MKNLIFLLLLLINITSFPQQSNERPDLLIPFNDNGIWGWCDTLGNVVIKPKYSQVGFFYKVRGSSNQAYQSNINHNGHKNFYIYNSGLLIPEKYVLVKNVVFVVSKDTTNNDLYIVKNNKELLGIYHTKTKSLILECEYDSIYAARNNEKHIFFKKKGDKVFSKLNGSTLDITTTDIIAISYWNHYIHNYVDELVLYKHQDGNWTRLNDSTHVAENFDVGDWQYDEDLYYAVDSPFSENTHATNSTNSSEILPDKILEIKDFSMYPTIKEKYGFQKLIISRMNGRVGMSTEKDSIVVPFIYDDIIFNEYNPGYVKLINEGKEGVKLIFTSYPIIEAKYDKIKDFEFPHSLKVNDHWSFVVFHVQIGGQNGYVGENGIEYFRVKN